MLLQRIIITIALCTLYAYFFGRVSLQKFYQESVVVTHQQQKTESIAPPGMVNVPNHIFDNIFKVIGILPKQETGLGWKINPKETDVFNSTNTLEDYGYTLDEITNDTFFTNYSVRGHAVNGFAYFLEVKENLIKFEPDKTLVVNLNPELSYYFLLSDKHNRFISPNPLTFVKSFFPISKKSGEIIVYLKVMNSLLKFTFLVHEASIETIQTILHKKLNRNDHQCEESDEYNFSFCIEKIIIEIVGCQPYWMNLKDIKLCTTFEEHSTFVQLYMYYSQQPREKLSKETKCLRPCIYFEYKVKTEEDIFQNDIVLVGRQSNLCVIWLIYIE